MATCFSHMETKSIAYRIRGCLSHLTGTAMQQRASSIQFSFRLFISQGLQAI